MILGSMKASARIWFAQASRGQGEAEAEEDEATDWDSQCFKKICFIQYLQVNLI